MSKRTDVHRPADLDPANYVEVGYTDAHPEEGISWLDRDVLDNLPGGEKWFTGHYTTRGGCDHCGHGSLRYAAHYLHEPTGEIVSVGLTCAGKLDRPDRDRLTMIEKCRECGETSEVKVVRELGAGWTEPEDCPKCGGEFDPDSEEEFDPREEAAEAEFDRMREEGEV